MYGSHKSYTRWFHTVLNERYVAHEKANEKANECAHVVHMLVREESSTDY